MIQSRHEETQQRTSTTAASQPESTDRLKQHSADAKRQANELGRKASDAAHEAGESLKQAGREAADRMSETARQAGNQARERASTMVAERKTRLAEEVGVFSKALHKAADTLDENDDAELGRYAHRAGDFVDSCAGYLKDANAAEMVRGASNFTRRHPEVVLGGLFLAGVSIARFLKASERHDTRRDFDRDDFSGGQYAGGYREAQYDIAGYGDDTSDTSAYGDISRYASDMSTEASSTRNEDIPATTSPQPGSTLPSATDPVQSINRNTDQNRS